MLNRHFVINFSNVQKGVPFGTIYIIYFASDKLCFVM